MCILLSYAHYGEFSIETKEHLPIYILVVSDACVQEPIKKSMKGKFSPWKLSPFGGKVHSNFLWKKKFLLACFRHKLLG